MPKLREVVATTAAIGTLGMGVGAYKAHEAADEVKATSAKAAALHIDRIGQAELKNLSHRKDLQTIFLLGGAVLLGAGTAAGYRASAPAKKPRPTASHNA